MLPFLLSPLGRKLAAGVAAAALLGGVVWWIYAKGKAAGQQAGAASQTEEDRRQMQAEKAQLAERIRASEQREKQAVEAIARYQAIADAATRAISVVQAERRTVREKVEALPESALLPDIAAKLAVRAPNDPAPNFYPAELRAIDAVLTDSPLLKRENQLLGEKVAAIESKVEGLAERVQAVEAQRDAWSQWAHQVETHYVRAYNAIPRSGNLFLRVITFGVKGKPRKLDFPGPADLGALRPTP